MKTNDQNTATKPRAIGIAHPASPGAFVAQMEGEQTALTSVEVVMAQAEGRIGSLVARAQGRREMAEARLEAMEQVAQERLAKILSLEAELRRIGFDLNLFCDIKPERDRIAALGRILDAAREVAIDWGNGRSKLTERLREHLTALSVHVAEYDGDDVSEEDYLAVHGELPADARCSEGRRA